MARTRPPSLSRLWKQLLFVGGLLIFALLTAGCVEKADWEAFQWQATTPAGDLHGTHTVGQTFVSDHAGLSSIEVTLVDYGEESGREAAPLELRLCGDLLCQQTITRTTIPVEVIAHNVPYRLRFPPQHDSAGKTYLLLVSAPQASALARATLWAHSSDLYPNGFLVRDGQKAMGDLNFWVFYDVDPLTIAGELFQQAWGGLIRLPGLLFLLLAPGYLLLRLLPRSEEDDPIALLGTCLALSIAVIPIVLLILSRLTVTLTGPAVFWGGNLLGALALGLLVRDLLSGYWRGTRVAVPVLVAMVGIVGVGLALRAVHALGLVGPLWVDAVHHTLLTRMIVEQGAIPTNYLPYVEVDPATYHFGFQSLVAVLHGLTGMPLPSALLLLGQTLSGLAGLPLYALGKRWGKSPWAGLGAALIPSALSLMPAYYISWSRYTEPAGLFILPVAALLLDRLIRRRRWHWGLGAATTVAVAGLVVTHLRVAAFLAILAFLLVLRATLEHHYQGRALWTPWIRGLAVALVAAGLIWAWLWPSIRHLWLPAAQAWPIAEEPLSLHYILFGPGEYVVRLAVLGASLGLLWRRQETILLFCWVGFLPVLSNPRLVGLQVGGPLESLIPGLHIAGVVDDTAVAIALYVPLSVAAALACGGLADLVRRVRWVKRGMIRWLRWAGVVSLVGLSVWGAYELREVVNSRTAILAPADVEAMAWIEDHTAPEALFLINAYEWMSPVYAGRDGGFWITPLTGRRTWPPPALYGLGTGDYIREINGVTKAAMDSSGGEELYTLLRQHGITHVYLGRYGGALTPEELLLWPKFQPVYQQDGVWIFEVAP